MKRQKDDYIIAVFTRGRVCNQIFLENIPKIIRSLITIVCHPGEKIQHYSRWNGSVANIIEYGSNCNNLGEARDWFMGYCLKNGIRYAIQIDDNVMFGARSDLNGNVKFGNKLLNVRNNFDVDTQTSIYVSMLQWMLESLRRGYGIAGISHRSGNNRKDYAVEENTRLFAVWGIDVKRYKEVGARFSENPFKEDFHMQLAFLTHGIKTVCNNCFTFDKARGANQKGGCSTYRDLSNVNKGSELLKEYYPEYVSLVEKRSNNWSNLVDNSEQSVFRKEVVVHWKKAFNNNKNHE